MPTGRRKRDAKVTSKKSEPSKINKIATMITRIRKIRKMQDKVLKFREFNEFGLFGPKDGHGKQETIKLTKKELADLGLEDEFKRLYAAMNEIFVSLGEKASELESQLNFRGSIVF